MAKIDVRHDRAPNMFGARQFSRDQLVVNYLEPVVPPMFGFGLHIRLLGLPSFSQAAKLANLHSSAPPGLDSIQNLALPIVVCLLAAPGIDGFICVPDGLVG